MSNRLVKETSPYLLQHAGNPVDWYPWGEEALARARTEDKPVLLSIGYAACHWCHVMAHKCFENNSIAAFMNDKFINIKVDREERPDLDNIYMGAVQSITGGGGWPLTVFLTPEGKPFFGGTYFPPEDTNGLPGFLRVLEAASDAYHNRRQEVEQAAQDIIAALNANTDNNSGNDTLTLDILSHAYSSLNRDFDRVNGGFGRAPKFPQPMVLEFLLRQYHRTRDKQALEMVTLTLKKMAEGGIYDQLGGGFHRYATDEHWLIPHFEKMLYDNALLSQLYLYTYLATRTPLFRRVAEETIDYVLREMTSPQGGFYSTQDADSEGEEGKHYLWTFDDLRETLGVNAADILGSYYGVTEGGNFEGQNILHITRDIKPEESGIINRAKSLLREKREKRVKPGRDEKILTSWNGLMLASLSEAAVILNRGDYLNAATANASFLLNSVTSEGNLRHAFSRGQSKIEGFLEDYAAVIAGLLNLHQATFAGKWLREAVRLTEVMVERFWDESSGTFYDTGKGHEALFVRPRNIQDGATPSSASAATIVLMRVSRLTDNERWSKIAIRSLKTTGATMSRYPLGFGNWLCTLDFHLSAPREIAFIGARNSAQTRALLEVLFGNWLPNKVVAARDPDDLEPAVEVTLLKNRDMIDKQPTVYVCEGYSCRTPVTDPDALSKQLGEN